MRIDVVLSGGRGRLSKVSAKTSSGSIKRTVANSNSMVSNLKNVNKSVSQIGSFMSGGGSGALSGISKAIPIIGMIYAGMQVADKVISFGSKIYQAHSGEDMLTSNIGAYAKTGSSLGMNIVSGFIENRLFVAPRITRQNYALDYNREIYNYNAFGEKNKIR